MAVSIPDPWWTFSWPFVVQYLSFAVCFFQLKANARGSPWRQFSLLLSSRAGISVSSASTIRGDQRNDNTNQPNNRISPELMNLAYEMGLNPSRICENALKLAINRLRGWNQKQDDGGLGVRLPSPRLQQWFYQEVKSTRPWFFLLFRVPQIQTISVFRRLFLPPCCVQLNL